MKKALESEIDLLTPEDVARMLSVKKRQLERFGIPCLHLGHKTRRYLRADLMAFLQSQRRVTSAGN